MKKIIIYFCEYSAQNGDTFIESFPDYSQALEQLENWIPDAKEEANKWIGINEKSTCIRIYKYEGIKLPEPIEMIENALLIEYYSISEINLELVETRETGSVFSQFPLNQ
jgi:hypothetical protein